MSSPRAAAVGALFVLVAGTAACGASSVAPKVQLRDALASIGEAGTATFALSLPSSTSDVRDFLVATGEDDPSIDDKTLGDLLGVEILAAYDRRTSGDPTDDAGRVQFRIDGKDFSELRAVDQTAYFRVDLDGLSDRFPEMADGVDTLRQELAATDLGPLQPVAEAALAGDWLSLDAGEGSWLAEQTKAAEEKSGKRTEELQKQLKDLLGKATKAGVTVRKAGADDLGERLIATANTRTMYAEVADELPGLVDAVAPEAQARTGDVFPPADEVPSTDVSATFWVKDDVLRRVELDLAQFLDKPTGHFVIRMDTAPGKPTVKAPKDAVEIPLEELMAQAGAAPAALLGGPGSESAPGIEELAMGVGYDFQYYADSEGVAPSVEHLPIVAEWYADSEPPLEMVAAGDRVQVTSGGEVACLTLPADVSAEPTVDAGPC
jgi:hypothetical protein